LVAGGTWPALRLEAPQPIWLASSSTTRAPPSAACKAAEHPPMPPPTMAMSQWVAPASGA
jgi:hypothetical protein